jgi:hypothetical protein
MTCDKLGGWGSVSVINSQIITTEVIDHFEVMRPLQSCASIFYVATYHLTCQHLVAGSTGNTEALVSERSLIDVH